MDFRSRGTRQAGISLVELLLSMTISMVLLGLLAYSVSSFTNTYVNSKGKVVSDRDAELALDYIIRDLESLFLPSRRDSGDSSSNILNLSRSSEWEGQWLTLLSLTNDFELDVSNGVVRAVSYRIALQDPIEGAKGGGDPQYALYRKVLSANDTFGEALLHPDLRADVWQDESLVPDLAPVEDFLAGNVVDLRVKFFSHDLLISEDPSDEIIVKTDGVYVNGTRISETVTAAEVSLTVLSQVGAARVADGIPLDELISKHGRVYNRQTSVFVQPLF